MAPTPKRGRGWQFRAVGSSKGISTPTTPLSVSRLSLFLIGQPCYLAPNLSGNGKDGAASHVIQERWQDQNQLQPNWAPTGTGGAPSATWPETEMGAPQAPRGRKRKWGRPKRPLAGKGAFSPALAVQPNRDRNGGATGLIFFNANRDKSLMTISL